MGSTITTNVVLETLACGGCGIVFAVPDWKLKELRRTRATFWCPNGHARGFTESEEDRLRLQLARAQRERDAASARAVHYRDQADATERVLRATKGQVTRLRNRVANGVCPCCNRSFANLARHMAGQHPNYGDTDA